MLKRSWDYGGKSVFLGAEMEAPATQTRLRTLMQRSAARIGWAELIRFALADGDAWVVQELVAAERAAELGSTRRGQSSARSTSICPPIPTSGFRCVREGALCAARRVGS